MVRFLLIALVAYFVWKWLSKLGQAQPAAKRIPSEPAVAGVPASSDPYAVLGVARGASAEQVRAAYQEKIQQYHPDKVATLGPELRALAEERTKALNAAYEKLKGGRA